MKIAYVLLVLIAALVTLGASAEPVALWLELHETPAAVAYIEGSVTKTGAKAQLNLIQTEQAALLARLSSKAGVEVLYSTQRLFNGLAVRMTEAEAGALVDAGVVKSVQPVPTFTPANGQSMPFLGIPDLWNPIAGGLTGRGISIGIIDTGIDYIHPDFGGTGDPAEHSRNNSTVLGDVSFPTAKVVGGFDFVGDAYDSSMPSSATPIPDPDPMDQNGHGTHVAGTAAGLGVVADGTPYTGGYSSATPLSELLIGPGAAPEADLYALKIFGKSGESQVLLPALEWAADPNLDGDFSDRLDVVNMSLGEQFGRGDTPESQAADVLAQLGTIVVAAAGNAGDIHFVTGMPGASPWTISVAAAAHKLDEDEGFTPDLLASFSSRGPVLSDDQILTKPDLTAPGIDIVSANAYAFRPGELAGARRGTSMATPHVAGVAALLRQQYPDWSVPALKALLINTATHPVYRFAGINLPLIAPSQAGAGRIDPPMALSSSSLALDADHPERVSISFQTTEVLDRALEERTIRIWNRGATAESYALRLAFRTFINGVTLRLQANQVGPVAPGEFVDVGLRLDALASVMRNTQDPAARDGLNGYIRQWLNEVSGNVVITPLSGAPELHVPFYGTMRPVSAMQATAEGVDVSASATATIQLAGEQLGPGTEDYSFEFLSLVMPFELLARYPATGEPPSPAHLQYIGAVSDYLPRLESNDGELGAARVFFGIAVQAPWDSLNRYEFTVNLDMDRDGVADYALYTSSNPLANAQTPRTSDVLLVRLTNFIGQDVIAGYANVYPPDRLSTAPFFSSVLVMPLTLASVNWTPGSPFDFWVTCDVRNGDPGPEDISDAFTWNPAAPGVSFPDLNPDMVYYEDLNGVELAVAYDDAAYQADSSLGVLLIHHHNAPGEQAEWLPVITPGDSDGDGIPDADEGAEDTDGDGLPNLLDTDSDGDGLLDQNEGRGDIDDDGVPNFLDRDSDDDSLPDQTEAAAGTNPYNADTDGDGRADGAEGLQDSDNDGLINALDPDSDNDGVDDSVEADGDQDEDGAPNFLDADSDDDTVPDGEEGIGDLDGDGTPDYLDTDSDGDGLDDRIEVETGTDRTFYDTDRDGRGDGEEGLGDADGDGLVNALDLDSDDDGLLDALEMDGDFDEDGLANFVDPDSDGDGLEDGAEGIDDADGDGSPNYLDLDADGDGLPDNIETTEYNTSSTQTDTDRDSRPDNVEVATGTDPTVANLPDAPREVFATDGTYPDLVLVRWEPGLGNLEWRVWRAPVERPAEAELLSDWLGVLRFEDSTAAEALLVPGGGCAGPTWDVTRYVYWVESRNGIGVSAPSSSDEGYRGRS